MITLVTDSPGEIPGSYPAVGERTKSYGVGSGWGRVVW